MPPLTKPMNLEPKRTTRPADFKGKKTTIISSEREHYFWTRKRKKKKENGIKQWCIKVFVEEGDALELR